MVAPVALDPDRPALFAAVRSLIGSNEVKASFEGQGLQLVQVLVGEGEVGEVAKLAEVGVPKDGQHGFRGHS